MELLIVFLPAIGIAGAIRTARGTTLVAPLVWALIAYVLTGLIATHSFSLPKADWEKWQFIGSAATLCPCMALFGAKRPQNKAWQLIVAAFWFVLALPAFQSLLFHAGEPLEIHTIWKWLLVVLIGAGVVNYLPTRYGWAAVAIAAGQLQLFWNHLPVSLGGPLLIGRIAGYALLLFGLAVAYLLYRVRHREIREFRGWNRAWIDFRDSFGVVWGLRVMERVNKMPAATQNGLELSWQGFHDLDAVVGHKTCTPASGDAVPAPATGRPFADRASPVAMEPLDPGLRSLLRRFVSKQWLASRLTTNPASVA